MCWGMADGRGRRGRVFGTDGGFEAGFWELTMREGDAGCGRRG